MRAMSIVLLFACTTLLCGQVPVPITTEAGRFVVHANGRFEKIEPRPPRAVYPMEGCLVYQDHDGDLKIFVAADRRLNRLDAGNFGAMKQAGNQLAWLRRDSLLMLRDEKAALVATGVSDFSVSDSLVVFHDSSQQALNVVWRGKVHTLTTIEEDGDMPQWLLGGNTVIILDPEAQRIRLFHQGEVLEPCDSVGMGSVEPGSDMVAYWDEHLQEMRLWQRNGTSFLSDRKPRSMQAGKGLLAFVDAYGRLRCYDRHGSHTLTETMPSEYWVRDSLLLYLQEGHLMLYDGRVPVMVEPYIPEQWEVHGGRLVYLDINRTLRSIDQGERERPGKEHAIDGFKMYGDAILYTSPSGPVTVIRGRRSYLF